ncbi:MAG TPA: hypothetical protein VD908_18705 [Cytophagales bacterium]|nr:hypothetical protein [Cytophagales bacterium]
MKIKLRFRFLLIFLLLGLGLVSCAENDIDTALDDTPTVTPEYGPNFKFYTDSNLFLKEQSLRTSTHNAPFTIKEVKKVNENLKITVNYQGGCSDHSFDVVWDGVINLSKQKKVNLIVKHVGNDQCKTLVSDTIVINLNKYFNNLIEINNTLFNVSNGSSIQEVNSEVN